LLTLSTITVTISVLVTITINRSRQGFDSLSLWKGGKHQLIKKQTFSNLSEREETIAEQKFLITQKMSMESVMDLLKSIQTRQTASEERLVNVETLLANNSKSLQSVRRVAFAGIGSNSGRNTAKKVNKPRIQANCLKSDFPDM
jgi:hypothetical protein